MGKPLDYPVNYAGLDPQKVAAQKAGVETDRFLKRFGFEAVPWSRGESVFLVRTPFGYIGLTIEGLGTKSLVADAMKLSRKMLELTGRSFYDNVGQCNAAMAFNDMITLGPRPAVYGQYLAVQNADWFNDEERGLDLIKGTERACRLARCSWGCGETPELNGIIVPGTADLAGGTWGFATEEQLIRPDRIAHGDAIAVVESTGIHANGLTLARKIAQNLPKLYLTELPDGRTYGETLLDPTHIYVGLVEDCQNKGVEIKYAVNITGHGWSKFMRPNKPFRYVIERRPHEPPIFAFMQEHGPVTENKMYSTFNMGAGFALYVAGKHVDTVVRVAKGLGLVAFRAGHIERSEKKEVIVEELPNLVVPPLNIR